jgi:hypothetical protein
MAEPHTHAAGLQAQCGFGAFCKPGNFLDRGPRLRMRAQFFLFSFGVFTANALLDLLSHNMLLIWEGALLTSCYNLSIIKLASYNAYPRRPERTRKRRADDRQHRGFRTLIISVVFLFGLCRKIWVIHFRAYPLPPANLSQ